MTLPEKGWTGYGSPNHPYGLTVRTVHPHVAFGNRCGVARHEMDAEVADYRLRHDGIKPELLAYLEGIGRAVK